MTPRTTGVELSASSASGLISAGNDAQQLGWALNNFLLEWCGIDAAFAILAQLDLVLLVVATDSGSGRHAQQVVNLFVVNFQVAHSQQKLTGRSLANVGEYISNGEGDDTRLGAGSLHGKGFASARHSVSKNGSVISFHDAAHQALRNVVIYSRIIVLCGKYIIYNTVSDADNAVRSLVGNLP